MTPAQECDRLRLLIDNERLKKQRYERMVHACATAEAVLLTKLAKCEDLLERERGNKEKL